MTLVSVAECGQWVGGAPRPGARPPGGGAAAGAARGVAKSSSELTGGKVER